MIGAGYDLVSLGTNENHSFAKNIDDICAICLQQHENGRTSNMLDFLPVQDSIKVYKLLESISQFKYNERTPQLLCSTCSYKLVNIYEFQQTCNKSYFYLNNYIKQKDAQDACKLEMDDIELNDLCSYCEDDVVAETLDTYNESKQFTGNVRDQNFMEETVQNLQKQNLISAISESSTLVNLKPTSTKALDATTEVLPLTKSVRMDTEETNIINKSNCSLDSLDKREKNNPDEMEIAPHNTDNQARLSHDPHLKDPGFKKKEKYNDNGGSHTNKYVCMYCNKSFRYGHKLKAHIEVHEDVRKFLCTFCGSKFRGLRELLDHERIHSGERPFKCNQCEWTFSSHSNLKHHKITHTTERPFSCEKCAKTFKEKNALKLHMLTHTNPRSHVCSICSRGFTHKSGLTAHMHRHATGVYNDEPEISEKKPYKCKQCEKSFATARSLRKHGKVHSEERRHACKLCDSKYKDSKSLKYHMMKHSGLRPFICSYCNKDFNRKSTLRGHMQTQHSLPY